MNIGGQAVIEGVMMRNKEKLAIAVRLPNGKIKVKKEKSSQLPKLFNFFFVRGIVGLVYALSDGIKALTWSSEQQLGEEEKLTKTQMFVTIALALVMGVVLFVLIPFFSARWFIAEGFWFNFLDGVLRAVVFLGYLLIISSFKDVKRLFQYHGAEHKAIACYEAGKELKVENVKDYSRFHPRCGTSFLFLVILISIVVFSFLTGGLLVKLLGRIVLIPVIAGISYELLKLGGKYSGNVFVKIVIAPGLWLQKITTKEPSVKQMEVGIAALKGVLE